LLAAPARVRGHDLYLFAFLGQFEASDKDEAAVADKALFGRWVRVGCGRVIHGGLLSRLSGLRGSFYLPAGAFSFDVTSSYTV
jgi:hypothetical protein